MKWEKQGCIYVPSGHSWWAKTHAHLPTVEILDNDRLRVYFACLDEKQYGRIGFIDIDSNDPKTVLDIADEPILDIGELGTFDDCGVVPSCIVSVHNRKYLYYVGFQRAHRVPYMLFSGLAIQNDQQQLKFERHAKTPILDRYYDEPFSRAAPYIMYDDNIFKMWYWSCVHWTYEKDFIHYNNVIRYATSTNGISWDVHPQICVEPDFKDEFSIGRPCVIRDNQIYKMWYSIRSHTKRYTIGYAESIDGIAWQRKDDIAGIFPSADGWDSEMVCYPVIIHIKDQTYMFYNGNQHGKSGFGYAILSK